MVGIGPDVPGILPRNDRLAEDRLDRNTTVGYRLGMALPPVPRAVRKQYVGQLLGGHSSRIPERARSSGHSA